MNVQLTPYEHALLDGTHGPANKLAMRVIVRMAEFYRAPRLLEISAAHIDSGLYHGAAGLEFAERLAGWGAKVTVPTTTNVSGVDEQYWQRWEVSAEWAEAAQQQMRAYAQMGCRPTWTCAPYQVELTPSFGQQVAWGESSAIVFANSVLGARTNRYPDFLDICAAITGRVAETGLHLTENRRGQIIFDVADIPEQVQTQRSFYPVLGSLIGKLTGNDIPVITNLQGQPSEDDLKAFGAASASSGAVALYHIVGVTPEAPTLQAACQGHTDLPLTRVTMAQLRDAWRNLTTADSDDLDLVVLGSPHFSLAEFKELVPLVEGRTVHPKVKFVITSSRAMAMLAERAGLLQPIKAFGAQITLDTCILTTPMLSHEIKRLMSNSAKYAYYAPGLLNTQITFGSLADCVESAVVGRVVRDDGVWN